MADDLKQDQAPDEDRAPETETPPIVEVAEPETAPVSAQPIPSGKIVEFVQDDGSSVRLHVLHVASDGGLTLLHMNVFGRIEIAGVRFDASGAVGTWHEPPAE